MLASCSPLRGRPFDPRPDPTGNGSPTWPTARSACSTSPAASDRELANDDDPDVSWGLPDFIAAEEMDRRRGYWWSPDGERIAAARVDDRPVRIWHIAGPVDPEATPRAVRYPAAGTDNAIVTLSVFDMQGGRVDIGWDVDAFPYLVTVDWSVNGPLTFVVESRDQKTWRILSADPATGDVDARPRGSRRSLAPHPARGPGLPGRRPTRCGRSIPKTHGG